MPTCGGCNQLCNCTLTEDGFWASRPTDGRRNTVVSGGGFDDNNPYILEFQLSEFYLPPSTEVRVPLMTNVATSPTFDEHYRAVTFAEEYFFQYESPSPGVITPPPALLGPGDGDAEGEPGFRPMLGVHQGEFNLIGASATFPPAASGDVSLSVAALSPSIFNFVGLDMHVIAGARNRPQAAASTFLSCYGFAPSRFDLGNISPVLAGPIKLQLIYAELFQTTGAPINVTNVKVWMTTI